MRLDGIVVGIASFDADLVVVGCRGIDVVPTQLLCSTSAQLAILTPCPILIAPDRTAPRELDGEERP